MDDELPLICTGLGSSDIALEKKLWKNVLTKVIHKLVGRVGVVRRRGIDTLSYVDVLLEDIDEGITKVFDGLGRKCNASGLLFTVVQMKGVH